MLILKCGHCEYTCDCLLLVPEKAVAEPGYIKAWSSGAASGAKHEFQALAQTAYYQYQDDELDCGELSGPCRVESGSESAELDSGMVIFRTLDGRLKAAAHSGTSRKKLLETANRYCTRWVRLDI